MSVVHRETLVAGVKIHWIEAGSGDAPPFVLIHGWGSSVVKWLDVMPLLAPERRVIAVDLPGFGQSDVPRASYSPAWLAGSVRAFMDAIAIERALVIGNSLGGLIAIYLAAAWPERVDALIAAAPALPNDEPPPDLRSALEHVIPAIPVVGEIALTKYLSRPPQEVIADGLRRNCVDPSRVSAGIVRALEEEAASRVRDRRRLRATLSANRQMMWALSARREQTWSVVRTLRVPTLFLWGEGDKLLAPSIGERAVTELPGAQLIVIPDCGHNPQIELPREFAGAVTAFIRSLAARAS